MAGKLPPKHITVNSVLFTRVKGYTRYYISGSGDVWDTAGLMFLKRYTVKAGYQYYYLWKYGKQYYCYIHTLVATAYVPNPQKFKEVSHEDNIKANNHYSNLKWVTHRQNVQHRFM